MVLLAFSVQGQVEKYGAYVSIACFFGLAVLSLLYFAQAREVRRLREWAGRAPERAQELEERVVAQAESVRRVPQPVPVPAPRRAAAPAQAAAAPATNGAHKLKPEEVAALAFARAAGVASPPHPPQPAPVPQPVAVAAEAPPAEVAVGTATAEEAAAVPAPAAGNGSGNGEVPPPATPAGRRVPAAPLRATPPPRRPAPAPARRTLSGPPPRSETSTRSVVLTGLLIVVVLVAVVFAGVQVLGGGGSHPSGAAVPTVSPVGTPKSGGGAKQTAKPAATPARGATTVAVLNGTTQTGLAATALDQLLTAGYANKNTSAGNNPASDQGRTTSVVMYTSGARAQARDVAKILSIQDVKPIDAATQANGGGKSVVVVVGADKSGA